MSLHKITAGSGYDYLTRQVAVQDSTEKGHLGLASYYTQRGESPGVWLGSGMAGIDGLDAGDVVTAEQMQNLFGAGMHPLAQQRMDALHGPGLTEADYREVSRLGTPFKIFSPDVSPFRVEVAKRLAALNLLEGAPSRSAVAASERARIRTEVGREFFRAEFGRDPADARELAGLIATLSRPQTTAIAGFDLTFSPVKSVSTLWALADPATAAIVERCHQAAIADALRFVESHALFTRTGAKGVRQVDVRGLVAAAFTHRDSRAGDPDLHTHVAVANKVQTHDGRWLSIDGRVLFKAKVTASETYNTALERHLADAFGVRFVDRTTSAGRRPVREIDGVDPALNVRWSARRRSIEARRDELAVEFQARHGRPPTPIETLALAQQANLQTRDPKHEPRALAEQRATWRAQAEALLGGPDGIRRMIHTALHPGRTVAPVLDEAWFTTTAASIVATVEGSRATWQTWHVRAEAQRRARAANVPSAQLDGAVDRLVTTALGEHSLPLAVPTDGITEPSVLQRVDGQSVYTVAGAELFTSKRILAAEQRLVEASGRRDGRMVDPATVDLALLETAANGVELNAGQVALVRAMACSGARVQVAIAPAGSGKTTAMRALARAWSDAGGTVVGLAPSAAAAAALGAQIDTHTDTLAKLTWSIEHNDLPDWAAQIGPDTLVVIDEAGMADTLSLDAAVTHLLERGASVRLIGDDQQLAAIGAGGVLRDIATRHGAARLNELVRFADPAEGGASLALRDGNPEALGFYLDHDRVHVGDLATITDNVFDAWQTDRAAGLDTIMLAPTRDLVADLNTRARTHRLNDTLPGQEVELADGLSASIGDVIITRTNDRRLRVTATDWVKNGDRWTITALTPDGGVRALHTRSRRSVVLPADYVATSVELGYASTVHTAQGVSVDTMHGLATGTEGRQQLYTMLTRGRHANHVYLQVVGDGDPHSVIHPETIHPQTATDILEAILARDTAPTSATNLQRQLVDPRVRLGEAVARYTDALSAAAEDLAGDLAVRALERQVDHLLPGVPWCDAWPALRAHLLLIAADGHDPLVELRRAASEQPLTGAGDPAAVLDWRLDATGLRGSRPGPLPWIPAIPSRLRDHPEWGPYLDARARLVTELADTVHQQALTTGRTPAWLASTLGQPTGQTIADLTVWRAAMAVPDADLRPTGERQFPKATARWQRHLDRRLAGDRQPAMAEWGPLLRHLERRLAGDDFTPTLAARLAQLSASGLNARGLLHAAAGEGDLPDDHAAAALWWRIARHLTPAVTAALDTDQPLTTTWTTTLADTVGAESATELQASRWWPALITAVDHGVRQGWTPTDLLTAGTNGDQQVDDCLALVWRISTLTDPAARFDDEPEPPHPADEPPADLWDSFEPAHPILIGNAIEHDEPPAVDLVGEAPFDVEADEDRGDNLWLQAMIRDAMGLPEPTDQDVRRMFERADAWRDCPSTPERLAEINRLTAAFYADRFPGSWAQPYLESRFGVDLTGYPDLEPGYAPSGWTTLVHDLHALGVTDDEMLAAGVATTTSTGRLIDRFRDRAVFPIRHDGVILGFVGRRHPDRTDQDKVGPKYLNTGDTPLFHKGDQLYVTGSLGPDVTPVIVEGPMDAIAVTLATNGKYLGVAPLGTSLTDEQAAQLRQLGHRTPIVATDADLAGRVAAERDYWILTPYGHDPRYAALPDGTDPAALVATGRTNVLTGALDNAKPLALVLIDERFAHLPAADAALDALRVIAAQTPEHWETGVQDIAERVPLPVSVLRTTLADLINAWNEDPRARAQIALRDVGDVKTRLVHQAENGVRERVTQSASRTALQERRLVNRPLQSDRRRGVDL